MTDDQINSLVERLVVAFERTAFALEGLNETYRRIHKHENPERVQVRQAVVTNVPSREDRIREAQGSADQRPLDEWLGGVEEAEDIEDNYVGPRDREWAINHPERTR